MAPNRWRDGTDPIQRWLRVVTTLVVLAVFVALALDRGRGGEGVVTVALALGAVLILLGYERLVRLPVIGRGEDDQPRKDGGDGS